MKTKKLIFFAISFVLVIAISALVSMIIRVNMKYPPPINDSYAINSAYSDNSIEIKLTDKHVISLPEAESIYGYESNELLNDYSMTIDEIKILYIDLQLYNQSESILSVPAYLFQLEKGAWTQTLSSDIYFSFNSCMTKSTSTT